MMMHHDHRVLPLSLQLFLRLALQAVLNQPPDLQATSDQFKSKWTGYLNLESRASLIK
jgi:hypothetical protein